MTREIWVDVLGYEGIYKVSNLGKIKSLSKIVNCRGNKNRLHNGRILKTNYLNGKRETVVLCHKNKPKTQSVCRVVAIAFIPNPLCKREVNHMDGDQTNNKVSNLEWCTGPENMRHAYLNGLINNTGENHGRSKLTNTQVIKIRELYKNNSYSIKKLSQKYNVGTSTIYSIVARKTWKHI